MKAVSVFLIGLMSLSLPAQQMLTLEEVYSLAEKNYPLGKQIGLIDEKTAAEIEILEKEKLPKLNLKAQASYQSDVTGLPGGLPGLNFDSPNKDQYRATIEADQLIYDGGSVAANTKLKKAEMETNRQQVIVDLYQLKYRVNQYYFSALLLQQQKELLISKRKLLTEKLRELESGIKHGAVLPANGQLINAEILKLDQQLTQIDFDSKKAYQKLSLLIMTDIDSSTVLEEPAMFYGGTEEINRPEMKLFDLQENQLETSKDVISKSLFPKISGFAQARYGNPGLNMLDNSFKDFYMVGIRFNWNLFDWGASEKKKQSADISKQIVRSQKESFVVNNRIEQKEAENDILKYEEMIKGDDGIISLREEVLKSKAAQLKYGTITSSEYITELDNLYEAKINQQLHKTQLSLSIANYRVIAGE